MSRYDGADHYTYPGTCVLINKAGIKTLAELEAFEADATAVRVGGRIQVRRHQQRV